MSESVREQAERVLTECFRVKAGPPTVRSLAIAAEKAGAAVQALDEAGLLAKDVGE